MSLFKVSFVYPHFNKFLTDNRDIDRGLVDYYLGDFTTPPSLGIPIMASWTPEDIEMELLDDNSGDVIDYAAPTGLVAINCFTPQATRAFEIADEFRRHGKQVIMGGFFPSFMVEECLKHADSVNIGEVEPTWLQILEDARNGRLKEVYKGGCCFDITKMRIPRRDIFYSKKSYTWEEDLVQITRGCNYNCAMCAIPNHMGFRIRFRPIEHVVEEIKTLKFENVYLADDTLFFPQRKIVEYSMELFEALVPLKKKYFVASTMALKTDPAFFDRAAAAGVCNFYCTMNVDPVSIRAIQGDKAAVQQLIDLVNMLGDRNIRFFGSFAIGREWDDNSIADRTLELYHKANIRTSEFFLFTPYPGSKQWERLDRQGRIFDKNWSHYNGAHLVAEHPVLSRDELYGQFVKVWNEFFKVQKERNAVDLEPLTYKKGREIVGIPLQRSGVPGHAVITGIGVRSPVGNSPEEIAENLDSWVAAVDPAGKINTRSLQKKVTEEAAGFNTGESASEGEREKNEGDGFRYVVDAAKEALRNAETGIDAETALVIVTHGGGVRFREYGDEKHFDEEVDLQVQGCGLVKALSTALGITGRVRLVNTGSSSSAVAAGFARRVINEGQVKKLLLVVATGVSDDSGARTGGDVTAAVCWVVEEMESALLRHAHCKAKLAGYATRSGSGEDAVRRALTAARDGSGVPVRDVGMLIIGGTAADVANEPETEGIGEFFGNESIPVVFPGSLHRHCGGVEGLLNATGAIVAMNRGCIPPAVRFTDGKPDGRSGDMPGIRRYDTFILLDRPGGGDITSLVITKWDKEIGKVKRRKARISS